MEYVKPEARVVYILECLKKTPPPVLIFAEKKQDVDAIQEYLLLKGVQAVATHGGKGASEARHRPIPLLSKLSEPRVDLTEWSCIPVVLDRLFVYWGLYLTYKYLNYIYLRGFFLLTVSSCSIF